MIEEKHAIQDILNEADNLKKYNNDIANNVSGDTLENYVNKINNDILKIREYLEENYENNNSNTEIIK